MAIIIDIDLLELIHGAIVDASPIHCLFQTNQTIPVEIKTDFFLQNLIDYTRDQSNSAG